MVSAMAVCVNMLEGAQPAGDFSSRATGVWEYRFRRGNQIVTAIWSPIGRQQVKLNTSSSSVDVADMMGKTHHIAMKQHSALLDIGEAPVYVSWSTTNPL